jgi:serine/threonine protein kinase
MYDLVLMPWLLLSVLNRGGRYSEEDAKVVVELILSIVSFCHIQGVVHRDLKPEVPYTQLLFPHNGLVGAYSAPRRLQENLVSKHKNTK